MPKVPSNPTTKLLIARGGPSPHCGQRRVETDRTPIHQQKFPTKHPLRADNGLVVEPSLNVIDSLPIHRQSFPIVSLSVVDPTDWEMMDSDDDGDSGNPISSPSKHSSKAQTPPSSPKVARIPTKLPVANNLSNLPVSASNTTTVTTTSHTPVVTPVSKASGAFVAAPAASHEHYITNSTPVSSPDENSTIIPGSRLTVPPVSPQGMSQAQPLQPTPNSSVPAAGQGLRDITADQDRARVGSRISNAGTSRAVNFTVIPGPRSTISPALPQRVNRSQPLQPTPNCSLPATGQGLRNITTDQDRGRVGSRTSNPGTSRAVFSKSSSSSARKDKKIRDLEEYMGWYTSSGSQPLEAPPSHKDAEYADIFVHLYGEEDAQVWMRTAMATWQRVNPGHDHPYLPGYRLMLKDGRPRWVTRKTIATYHYRR